MHKIFFSLIAFIAAIITVGGISTPKEARAQQRLVTAPNTTKVYAVADNGTKRWLQSPAILRSYGFSFGQIEVISPSALNQIPRTKAIRLGNNPGVYLLTQEGVKQGIGSLEVLRAAGLSMRDVVSVNQRQFNAYPTGRFLSSPPDIPPTPTTQANLISTANSPRVYGIAPNGTKRWFRSPAVLRSYGFNFSQVRTVSPAQITNIPNTKAIRAKGQPQVYRLNPNWTKQHITSPQVLSNLGLSFSDVVVVNQTELASYPTGNPIIAADQPTRRTYRTYRNQDMDFRIDFPASMQTNRTQQNTVRFLLTGPTQEPDTEVTDGILLTVRRESLQGMALREYAAQQTEGPTVDAVINPVHPVTINGIAGYRTTIQTLGVVTHIFLPSIEGATFHISYVNPDPNNRGYQQIVDHMLSTFGRL